MDGLLGYPTEHMPHRIRVALTPEQLALYQTNARIAAQRGFRTEPLDVKALRELVPIVGDNAVGGLYLHFGGHANPQRTVQAYAWALQDLGGRIRQHTPATGFKITGGRVTAVLTEAGPVGADSVVLAAGPATEQLAARLGVRVPLAPSRVEMICTEPIPLMQVGGVDGNGLYGRQTRRGNLVYGGGPHEWLDDDGLAAARGARPTTPLLRSLGRRLAELFRGAAHVRIIRSWAGIVENTPDGLPIIDRLTEPANVVLATMSSVGFGLSPASGKAISELVLHGQCRFCDLTALRLSRFADTPPDWRARLGWLPSGSGLDSQTIPTRTS
jgi:sarcosine oxidase subunit beta